MSIKAFENNVSNTRGNRKLCVAGIFATESGGDYTPAAAYPGQVAVQSALTPSTAYAGKKNPNTWYMVAADDNTALKDLYVASPDVASTAAFNNSAINFGMETLGVPALAGEACRFQKVEEGDLLTFGDAWFASAPTASDKYAVLNSSGLWAPDDQLPASGFYFEVLETVAFTVGCYAGGTGYYGIIKTV